MRKVWKWIIGFVIVLVVVALVVGGAFLLRSHFGGVAKVVQTYRINRPRGQVPPNGKVPFNGNGQRGGPGWMMPYAGRGYYMRGPGLFGFGMMPFFGILGSLFFLGFLVLVILGIVWLVRSQSKPQPVAAPSAFVATAAPATPEPPVSAPTIGVHTCKKCGQSVQDDWKHCPNCGKKQ